MKTYYPLLALYLAAAMLLVPVIKVLARRLGAVDNPTHLKIHQRATPRMGGVAIAVPVLIAACVRITTSESQVALGYLLGGLLVLCIGVLDDARNLSPISKLMLQITAAAIGFAPLTHLWGWVPLATYLAKIGTAVVLMNAVNLVDGMDGLAAGVAIINAAALFFIVSPGSPVLGSLLIAMVGATAGFLLYNFPPASIFMGDSGSLFLGYTFAFVVAPELQFPLSIAKITGIGYIVGIWIFDLAFSIFRRALSGQPLFSGDTQHFYNLMAREAGMGIKRTVLAIYASAVVTGCFGLIIYHASTIGAWAALGLWLIVAGACSAWLRQIAKTSWHSPGKEQA